MLPEKYRDTDVRELFPEFRPNSVLRFSRLFPIKASHRPRIYKNIRRKRKEQEESVVAEENNKNLRENGTEQGMKSVPAPMQFSFSVNFFVVVHEQASLNGS